MCSSFCSILNIKLVKYYLLTLICFDAGNLIELINLIGFFVITDICISRKCSGVGKGLYDNIIFHCLFAAYFNCTVFLLSILIQIINSLRSKGMLWYFILVNARQFYLSKEWALPLNELTHKGADTPLCWIKSTSISYR